MNIYCATDTEGSLYFFNLSTARIAARASAHAGKTGVLYRYQVKRITKEAFLAAVAGRGWADSTEYLESWVPIREGDQVKGVQKVYQGEFEVGK